MNKIRQRYYLIVLFVTLLYTACTVDDTPAPQPQPEHTKAVKELIEICNTNSEVRGLLQHAISQAAEINPDRRYNPAQTLDEFYAFVDRNVRCLPWDVMIHPAPNEYGQSLYGHTVQGIGYDEDTLIKAGIEDCDVLAAVTESDNANLMVAEVASKLFGVKHTIARLQNADREHAYQQLGLDYVCGTPLVAEAGMYFTAGILLNF